MSMTQSEKQALRDALNLLLKALDADTSKGGVDLDEEALNAQLVMGPKGDVVDLMPPDIGPWNDTGPKLVDVISKLPFSDADYKRVSEGLINAANTSSRRQGFVSNVTNVLVKLRELLPLILGAL